MLDANLTGAMGALLATLSGGAFYLASRHRKVLVERPIRGPAIVSGVLLSLGSLPLLCTALAPLAATFTWVTLLMLALTIAPFAPLLRRIDR